MNLSEKFEDAQTRGLLKLEKDSKSGGYLILGLGAGASPA